jgi:TetR/AcrR family transcriptional regulator, transcriptional repressor of bet genes
MRPHFIAKAPEEQCICILCPTVCRGSPLTRHEDPQARRRQIARAVWTLAAQRGLEAASLRNVAAEAGVSMGLVQHHFASKEKMLIYACEHLVERAEEGMRRIVAGSADPDSPRSVIRAVAVQTLPLTHQQRTGAGVWFAFLSRAVRDADLAAFIRGAWDGTLALVTEQLQIAQAGGELIAGVDPQAEAAALLSLVDGLVSHLLVEHCAPNQALAMVDAHIDRLFRSPGTSSA